MAGISIKDINKKYGSFEAIPELSLDIKDGEFVILVGPSGCGKSTLLRMLAGLESITRGDIFIDDKKVNDLMPRQRDIAMVFQSYALYPHMTVAQNMGFSLKLEKRSKDEINKRVNEAAEILGLNPLLGRYPKQLSGGQRQRVAMGRSIVRDPKVFLFDEPLSNLDAKLRVQMRAEIKALHQRLKTTIVYVTHDQVEAMTMADRIVVMSDGKIEQVGAPLDLYDRPVNRFVAEFLGSPAMNLIEGEIVSSGDKTMFKTEDGLSLTVPSHKAADSGRKLMMGFRPEWVAIEGAPGQESAKATVGVLEPTGSSTLLTAMLGDTMITCELKERIALTSGEAISLFIDPTHLLFFDKESGKRVDA